MLKYHFKSLIVNLLFFAGFGAIVYGHIYGNPEVEVTGFGIDTLSVVINFNFGT